MTAVTATIGVSAAKAFVRYEVGGGDVRWPAPAPTTRTDGLWQTTCFEMFVRSGNDAGYTEFNFSPSTQWAAYRFDGRRTGIRDIVMEAPIVERVAAGVSVTFDLPVDTQAPLLINLTAVVEEQDGTKSYWALAHPDGGPDFHDPACFVLELPALG